MATEAGVRCEVDWRMLDQAEDCTQFGMSAAQRGTDCRGTYMP